MAMLNIPILQLILCCGTAHYTDSTSLIVVDHVLNHDWVHVTSKSIKMLTEGSSKRPQLINLAMLDHNNVLPCMLQQQRMKYYKGLIYLCLLNYSIWFFNTSSIFFYLSFEIIFFLFFFICHLKKIKKIFIIFFLLFFLLFFKISNHFKYYLTFSKELISKM